jgi:hypothetical protein
MNQKKLAKVHYADVWGLREDKYKYLFGQVMEKYLKDRKGWKLSLDEINYYMKMAKAIHLTIELQEKIDNVSPS